MVSPHRLCRSILAWCPCLLYCCAAAVAWRRVVRVIITSPAHEIIAETMAGGFVSECPQERLRRPERPQNGTPNRPTSINHRFLKNGLNFDPKMSKIRFAFFSNIFARRATLTIDPFFLQFFQILLHKELPNVSKMTPRHPIDTLQIVPYTPKMPLRFFLRKLLNRLYSSTQVYVALKSKDLSLMYDFSNPAH